MSEEIKGASVPGNGDNPLLPKVDYPKLDMPEVPKSNVSGVPEGASRVACDGEIYGSLPTESPDILPPPNGKPRIMIGIPVLSYTHEFVESFMRFWTQVCLQPESRFQAGYYFMYRKPVNIAEIQLVEIAMFNKCTHILFMDDDIYDIKVDDVYKLLDADKDVIGGVMYASKFPHAMCVFRKYKTERQVIDMPVDNSMFRLYEIPCLCSSCGMGLSHWDAKYCLVCGKEQNNMIQKADLIPFAFTLMKIDIFKKIKKPWFHCTENYPTDSWFADRCVEAGIQEYAHMGVRLNHAGVSDVTKPFYVQMGLEQNKARGKGIVSISTEDMQRHEFILHQKMRDAEFKLKPKPAFVDNKVEQVEKLEEVKK